MPMMTEKEIQAAVDEATSWDVRFATAGATVDATVSATDAATRGATRDATHDATYAATRDAVRAIDGATRTAIADLLRGTP